MNQIYFRPIEVARILSSVLFDFFFTFALLGKKLHLHAIPIGHSINSSSSSHVKVRFLHSNSTWYVSIRLPLGFIVQLTNSSVDFTSPGIASTEACLSCWSCDAPTNNLHTVLGSCIFFSLKVGKNYRVCHRYNGMEYKLYMTLSRLLFFEF